MRLALLLLLALPLRAAITVTPNALTFRQVAQGFRDFGQSVAIGGSGAWSFGNPTGSLGALGATVIQYDIASGVAPTAVVQIAPYGGVTQPVAAGTYTGDLPVKVGGVTVATLAITLVIAPAPTNPTYLNALSVADNLLPFSTNTNSFFQDTDYTVPVPGLRPGSTFDLPTAPCGTYVDTSFGTTVKTISGKQALGEGHYYHNASAINLDKTYMIAFNFAGDSFLREMATCTVAIASLGANTEAKWSPAASNIIYQMTGATIERITVTPPTKLLETIFTHSAAINPSGTDSPSKDGWLVFADVNGLLCIIDVLATPPLTAKCGDTTTVSPALTGINDVQISKGIDPRTNKRYVMTSSTPYSQLWTYTPGAGSLVFDRRFPAFAEVTAGGWGATCTAAKAAVTNGCPSTQHDDTVETEDGHQYWVVATEGNDIYRPTITAHDLTTGDLMTTAVEAGGGMTTLWRMQIGLGNSDHVSGAMLGPYVGTGGYYNSWNSSFVEYGGFYVTGATGNGVSPIVLTVTGNNFVTGQAITCSGINGNTAANGDFIATVAGASVTLTGSVGNGAFSGSNGSCTRNITGHRVSHSGELVAIKIANGGQPQQVRRVVMHRSVGFGLSCPSGPGCSNNYYSTPRVSMCMRGDCMVYDSDGGRSSTYDQQTMLAPTGFIATSGATLRRGTIRGGRMR